MELDYVHETYGYPHMVGHRASLANGLYNGCKAHKAIKFNFSTGLKDVISFAPKVIFTAVPRQGEPYEVEPLTNGSDHTSLAATPLEMLSDSPENSSLVNSTNGVRRGRKPLYIREGGSIPSIRFLEKEFNTLAIYLLYR